MKEEIILKFAEQHHIEKRELALLPCVLKGKTNQELAMVYCISQSSIKQSLTKLFQRCQVKDRVGLLALFIEFCFKESIIRLRSLT